MTTIAVLATLDTKGEEVGYLKERIETLGAEALLVDIGVIGEPRVAPDVTREAVADAGGTPLAKLLESPTRQEASQVMTAGATVVLKRLVESGEIQGVIGLGGTQGTPNCTGAMQALPYGLPKIMVSTVASGDTSGFVGIKDVTMMFSVSDILGLNPLTRKILANAAGAAVGMARSGVELDTRTDGKPLIGMTNLGVLTEGATLAIDLFRDAGYEVIVFHAVGSGGRAMEQLMKEGVIGAVFDYSLGEIADDVHQGLRAGGPERLTVAGQLGLPQVICPGGAEHIGLLLDTPNVVPERFQNHKHVFHNPVIFAPRLNPEELTEVAREVGQRLKTTTGPTCLLLPLQGTSRYGIPSGPLHDPAGDRAFFDALREHVPDTVEVVEIDAEAEDPAFVAAAVQRLLAMVEASA